MPFGLRRFAGTVRCETLTPDRSRPALSAAMLGAGVLTLPWATSWLGWAAGPLLIAIFYCSTLICSRLLSATVEVNGVRHPTYRAVVLHVLGKRWSRVLFAFQFSLLVLASISYTIAAGESGRAVLEVTGVWEPGHAAWPVIVVFGGVQLVLSQMPNLESTWISSTVGALMSFCYSVIALGLCISHAGNKHGTVGGISNVSTHDKIFGIFNALGDVAFAYNFAPLLVEIQDTIRTPPSSDKVMKKALTISMSMAFFFYLTIAITGYLAFGNNVTGSILSQPGIGPTWVIVLANVMVFVHMFSAVQVFTQPLFTAVEGKAARTWPDSPLLNRYWLATRIVWRSLYMAFAVFISALIPFFSQIVGLVGAVIYWPTAIFFPILLWLAVFPPKISIRATLQVLNVSMLAVALVSIVGSVQSIVSNASTYGVFQ